ncbi:sugar kinase [Psychromarinibacter halotolerans]|uniref:Sugar kinase n=1 Tax=Psychromarinibacter halotolerans TaxID=1775175 RepID=A0ABV7GRU3_9RHOB|nr:sugar kinase [Psychromarinibacter halotolerans]MDF0596633.1 sugar kinase [Psychromarinibacter halotolerans]
MRVACVGEAMVELSLDAAPSTAARLGFAGDVLNTAIYLKRSAPELQVDFVTRVGRDAFSDRMVGFIAAEEVGTGAIGRSDDRNVGLYAITTDAQGERSFTYWRDSSAARTLFQAPDGPDFSVLEGYDVVYSSAITLAILSPDVRGALMTWLDEFRARGGRVAFDSNYRPRLWPDEATAHAAIERAWRSCDIALPSVDDEMAVFGDPDAPAVLDRLTGWGVRDGALKRGADGPVSLGEAVEAQYAPAAQVVDTTAAGDSFNGGYLAAALTGRGQRDALRAGHDLASMVVGVKGAIAPR